MADHADTARKITTGRCIVNLETAIENALYAATAASDAHVAALEAENAALREGLAFYANPETYHAIAFLPDSPCGEFVDDFSDHELYDRPMPGDRARSLLSSPDGWRPIDDEAKNGGKWLLATQNRRLPEYRNVTVGYWSNGRWWGSAITSDWQPYLYRPIPMPPSPPKPEDGERKP